MLTRIASCRFQRTSKFVTWTKNTSNLDRTTTNNIYFQQPKQDMFSWFAMVCANRHLVLTMSMNLSVPWSMDHSTTQLQVKIQFAKFKRSQAFPKSKSYWNQQLSILRCRNATDSSWISCEGNFNPICKNMSYTVCFLWHSSGCQQAGKVIKTFVLLLQTIAMGFSI